MDNYRDAGGLRGHLHGRAAGQPEHLRVLVGSLRKKIEPNPSAPKYILTEPWVGYRFADV